MLRTDLEKEAQAREESIKVIKECIDQDFPELEATIQQEVQDRDQGDQKIELELSQKLEEISLSAAKLTEARKGKEIQMEEAFKEDLERLQQKIEFEKMEREKSEEALLNLMLQTCSKLSEAAAI